MYDKNIQKFASNITKYNPAKAKSKIIGSLTDFRRILLNLVFDKEIIWKLKSRALSLWWHGHAHSPALLALNILLISFWAILVLVKITYSYKIDFLCLLLSFKT